jgi:hypothetical protein
MGNARAPFAPGAGGATGIIATIDTGSEERAPMEAERLNQIANQLADLQHRATDLRRYL